MSERPKVTLDGNEAAAYVAHATNEVMSIYPITPSSNMGEWADQWSAEGHKNIWGNVLDAAAVEKLASLESREVLLAKAAGAVQASLAKAAHLFAAPATQAVRTVDALRDKQEAAA